MKQFYKIKVGIEEFPIEEVDIPRIVEAMKSNDMVKLDCGIFRGNAILAVCRDEKKEKEQMLIEAAPKKTPEELEEEELNKIRVEQKMKCEICGHTGWMEQFRDDYVARVPCVCTIISRSELPVI